MLDAWLSAENIRKREEWAAENRTAADLADEAERRENARLWKMRLVADRDPQRAFDVWVSKAAPLTASQSGSGAVDYFSADNTYYYGSNDEMPVSKAAPPPPPVREPRPRARADEDAV